MTPTEKHIEEIAELLNCGMVCFFHRPTGTIEDYAYFEPEEWQETIDRIDANLSNYLQSTFTIKLERRKMKPQIISKIEWVEN